MTMKPYGVKRSDVHRQYHNNDVGKMNMHDIGKEVRKSARFEAKQMAQMEAEQMEVEPSPISLATMRATASGCMM